MNKNYFEIRNLSKNFGSLRAVDNLSISIWQGEIFGLLGPNGAGKTTIIQMVCGLLTADSGEILLDGQVTQFGTREFMHRVGICTQQNILWEKLTCIEQLEFMGTMYQFSKNESRKRGFNLLEQFGLSEKSHELAGKLSGGMQRRLNIALALIHNPELMIFDEPEVGLDPQSRLLVREYIQKLGNGKTVILTTHNMDEADRLSNRIAIIDHGKLLKLDTPENLKKTLGGGDVLEIELFGIPVEKASSIIANKGFLNTTTKSAIILKAHDVLEKLPKVLELLVKSGAHIGELHMRPNTLEDVFISLTGRNLRE